MQPRDHSVAARTVSALGLVAAVVSIGFAPIAPSSRTGHGPLAVALTVGAGALVALVALAARRLDEANRVAWAVCPLLAVVALVAIDLLTRDASVSAQIFFMFPTLYGASLLTRPGAVLMTAMSLAGEVVVVGVQLPLREALTDIGYVAAVLVTTAVVLSRSYERQAELVARLEHRAAIDPLTGLVTRRVLDEAAASALSGADSEDGTSLMLLDIDDFKSINDRYGHPGGDEVLVALGVLLTARSRRGDVVCRMGGDEIALLLPGCRAESARGRGEQILHDVSARPFELTTGEQVQVSVSVGLAHAPDDARTLRTLYAAADAALYQAKNSGRGRVVA
ncbi:MAG: GGDEF domain-containing protein [Nocardioidaceae bacterium]